MVSMGNRTLINSKITSCLKENRKGSRSTQLAFPLRIQIRCSSQTLPIMIVHKSQKMNTKKKVTLNRKIFLYTTVWINQLWNKNVPNLIRVMSLSLVPKNQFIRRTKQHKKSRAVLFVFVN
jgi:hypothetical protein